MSPLSKGETGLGCSSSSVLAACVVPSDKPGVAWNRDVKQVMITFTCKLGLYVPKGKRRLHIAGAGGPTNKHQGHLSQDSESNYALFSMITSI